MRFILSILIVNAWNFDILSKEKKSKIVGLMQVRNESAFVEQALRALAMLSDAIVIIDDASYDNTGEIIQKLAKELNIKKIITHQESAWQKYSERDNRNELLEMGRSIGGTHFILIDADEMFTAHCLKNNWLRKKILSLEKGQAMAFPMVNVWDNVFHYRDDALCSPSMGKWKAVMCVLCDDGTCNYNDNVSHSPAGIIHINRNPANRICNAKKRTIKINDIDYCLVHFKCANLNNIEIKRIWYMCLEYIRASKIKDKTIAATEINNRYDEAYASILPDTKNISLKFVPQAWYQAYTFFNPLPFSQEFTLKKEEVRQWFLEYGKDFFKPLNIWNVDWVNQL